MEEEFKITIPEGYEVEYIKLKKVTPPRKKK